jgi:purine-nucleoside phosphorylase
MSDICQLDWNRRLHYKTTAISGLTPTETQGKATPSCQEPQMKSYKSKVEETTQYLKTRIDSQPALGVLTGTGLGESVRSLAVSTAFAYSGLPHFPLSTVESHPGKLLFGQIGDCPSVVMQGRFHLYEGYTPLEVVFPIRVMQQLGVKVLIVTNAAGGLNLAFAPGDIMIISDHINLTGANPLVGPNEDSWGLRFPDMTRTYDPQLAALAEAAGRSAGKVLKKGVYAGLKGPSLETPAEVRYLKKIGADAVGFSTIQEVIAAVHGQMKVLALSTITNINNPDKPAPATMAGIIAVAEKAAPALNAVISYLAEHVDDEKTV